jgi:hypothetical protein
MILSKFYEPSGSYESFDTETQTFFNGYGQELRDPSEYDTNIEGYTPFGDE